MYNQSSLTNSKGSGPINAVDGNVLTSSITNNGPNEFWWGMFDATQNKLTVRRRW